jgi:S-adenosylmethionine-diacylglycerol 3-amino-3-carboxypropyl transferase
VPSAALKFAVVREDARLELHLVRALDATSALVVASGGCTALALACARPAVRVTAFDVNPRQLAHVGEKRAAAEAGDLRALNVGDPRPDGLNQRGAFEGLFRVLRAFVEEFVAAPAEIARFFAPEAPAAQRQALARGWLASPYWPAAFTTAFNDGLLLAMFGPAAIQHATPGSYPGYFQAAFERGLADVSAHGNPFLQHVFLGCYLAADAPPYVTAGEALAAAPIELVEGSLLDVPDLGRFQLYSLSNVFDWSDDDLVASWAGALRRAARPGSAVLIRQLNNRRDLRRFFEPELVFDDALGRQLWSMDRSLFYERVEVGFRR